MDIDLDKLEQAAKAAQEHSVAIGCDWLTEQEAACNMEQADAAFVAAASPQVVLELIGRLRVAEHVAAAVKESLTVQPVLVARDAVYQVLYGLRISTRHQCMEAADKIAALLAAQQPAVAATAPESGSQQ